MKNNVFSFKGTLALDSLGFETPSLLWLQPMSLGLRGPKWLQKKGLLISLTPILLTQKLDGSWPVKDNLLSKHGIVLCRCFRVSPILWLDTTTSAQKTPSLSAELCLTKSWRKPQLGSMVNKNSTETPCALYHLERIDEATRQLVLVYHGTLRIFATELGSCAIDPYSLQCNQLKTWLLFLVD